MVTGCLKIAKESIFTGTNNFVSNTITSSHLNEYYGFVQSEVDKILEDAGIKGKEEVIKKWYDGYRFGDADVYCPWDVMCYIDDLQKNSNAEPDEYWKDTSDNAIIRSFIDYAGTSITKKMETLMGGGYIVQRVDENLTYDYLHSSEENLWSMMYLTGYLTRVRDGEINEALPDNMVALKIPNLEIKQIFETEVAEWFEESASKWNKNALFEAVWRGDCESITREMSTLLRRTISYHDYGEDFYHAFLSGIFAGAGYQVDSNKEHGEGRSDVVVCDTINGRVAIFEAKRAMTLGDLESACDKALRQIDQRMYAKPDGGGNSGTIIVDATCAPSNIRYPQDVSLLNEARENAEKLLDILHSPTDGKKPRTYRKRAQKDYLKYVRCRKHTAKMTRKAIGKQLNYLKRDLAAIDGKLNQEKALNIHQTERLETIRKIYEQQKYMYDNHTHSVENRIVSVSQPFVRPIVRGKVGKPVEFGMKLDISVTDGWTRLEYRSFDAYNEATKLQKMIENFHKREGHYPSRVLADKIYRNRENLSYCKARGIRLSGPALGRPKKGEDRNKAQDYRDECERVEVERKFSLGKRKCGMGLVTAKLEETAAHVVALSILLLNLRKIQCTFLQFLDWLLGLLQSREKRMVIQ